MYIFFQIALSGIATGAIYGLIAVGYSLTFMTTKALNFALGMWVMLGGMLTYSLIVLHGLHPVFVLPVVAGALFVLGLVAERFTVMPFLRAGSDVWIMSTLAVGFLMIEPVLKINFADITEGLPAFLTLAVMPLTYSIADGMFAGIVSYVLLKLLTGRVRQVSLTMWAFAILLLVAKILDAVVT